MKHFYDKINGMSKQAISGALIINSDGDTCGKILIRYTDSQIGWNHEVGVLFGDHLALNKTKKGSTHSTPGTLYFMLRKVGLKCFDWHKKRIGDYNDKTGNNYDSLSRFSDICYIKNGRKQYRLEWLI